MKGRFEEKNSKVMATVIGVEIAVAERENGEKGTENRVSVGTDQPPGRNEERDEKGEEESRGSEV